MRIRCNTQILQCDGAIGTNAAYLEPPPEALVVSRDRNTGITFVYEYGRGTAVWEEALEGIRVFYYSRNGTRTNTFRCLGGQTTCSQDTGRSHLLAGDECVFNIFQNLIFSVFVEYLMPGRRCTESRILTPGASLLPRAVCLTQYAHGYVVGARTPIHNRPFCPLLAHTGARVVSPPPPTTSDADPPSPVPSRQSKRPNTPPPLRSPPAVLAADVDSHQDRMCGHQTDGWRGSFADSHRKWRRRRSRRGGQILLSTCDILSK